MSMIAPKQVQGCCSKFISVFICEQEICLHISPHNASHPANKNYRHAKYLFRVVIINKHIYIFIFDIHDALNKNEVIIGYAKNRALTLHRINFDHHFK